MNPSSHQLNDRSELLEAVRVAGVLTPGQLVKAAAALPAHSATASQAAQFLVATGFLTRFQAERLLAGRTGGFVLDQYVIQEQIGRGSVGRVYRAVHRTMNRVVAIRLFGADLARAPAIRQMLPQEVRAMARLNHPHIVTTYDSNEIGGRFYLAVEFVDGPTMDVLIRDRGPLPAAEACELIRQVAVGLQHAHELGLVHRDLKPQNLLIARASKTLPGCVVKITDFGIARLAQMAAESRAAATDPTPLPGLLGTPDYVAPEQALNPRTADHRADLYSLGCVFYHLLTGRPPFSGGSAEVKIRRHQLEAPIPVNRLRPDIPPTVAEIVHRLLAKDPNARFQSASSLAARLDRLAAGAVAMDDGTVVNFELPSVQHGSYSPASGYLTGMGGLPFPVSEPADVVDGAAETSPWARLTGDTVEEGAAVGRPQNDVASPARSPVPPAATRPGGVSVVAMLVLCGTAVALCMLAVGYLLRVLAR